nr:DNA repair exonuclease [uncultured Gellertiella sp.]
MAFRFIHTADIHLDSPLRSLSLRNPELASLIGDATRQAFVRIIDIALDEQVDALVIAGDLYDGEQTSMKTARFLATQLQRLDQAGIRTFVIRGNHDALSKVTQELVLPPSVKLFGGRAEAVELMGGGLPLAFHGISFARPQAPESLLPKFRAPVADAVNIGILHTSLAGAPGHDPYAPCTASDLHGFGFDYWALGHIHQRSHHAGPKTVVMPGMPQGRDINEAGPKSLSLVTVHADRRISVEERLTSVAEFCRVSVDVSSASDWRDLIGLIGGKLEQARENTRSEHMVARVRLTGATGLSFQLRRDLDLLQQDIEHRAEGIGRSFVEKLELAVTAPATASPGSGDPVAELGHLLRDEILTRHGFREDIREMIIELRDGLPREARGFSGASDAELDAFIETLLCESGEDIIALMSAPAREDL